MSSKKTTTNAEFFVALITSNLSETLTGKKHFNLLHGNATRKAARDTNFYTLGKTRDHKVVPTQLPEGKKSPPLLVVAEAMSDIM